MADIRNAEMLQPVIDRFLRPIEVIVRKQPKSFEKKVEKLITKGSIVDVIGSLPTSPMAGDARDESVPCSPTDRSSSSSLTCPSDSETRPNQKQTAINGRRRHSGNKDSNNNSDLQQDQLLEDNDPWAKLAVASRERDLWELIKKTSPKRIVKVRLATENFGMGQTF